MQDSSNKSNRRNWYENRLRSYYFLSFCMNEQMILKDTFNKIPHAISILQLWKPQPNRKTRFEINFILFTVHVLVLSQIGNASSKWKNWIKGIGFCHFCSLYKRFIKIYAPHFVSIANANVMQMVIRNLFRALFLSLSVARPAQYSSIFRFAYVKM